MRQISKGATPKILENEGAHFQMEALQFASEGSSIGDFGNDLQKFAVFGEDGEFHHYASGLFAKRSYYSEPSVKRQLIGDHHGKCAFCECFIMDTDVGDVEHFRPKAEVTRPKNGNPKIEAELEEGHTGYFWLAASWDNLYLSCKQCNQAYKRNLFDLFPDSPRSTMANINEKSEIPNLLSPASEDGVLRNLIRFNPDTAEVLRDPKEMYGEALNFKVNLIRIKRTIEIVGLNRRRLVQARANYLVKLRALFLLAASGSVLSAVRKPEITDATPAILDALAVRDSVAGDALAALWHAIEPTSEFSALALDALITWSARLEFSDKAVQVSQIERSVLIIKSSPLRLQPAVQLAEKIRLENNSFDESEAAPDISDLDEQYSALLTKYKAVIATLRRRKAELVANRVKVTKLLNRRNRQVSEMLKRHYDNEADLLAEMNSTLQNGGWAMPDGFKPVEEMLRYKAYLVGKGKVVPDSVDILLSDWSAWEKAGASPALKSKIEADDAILAEIREKENPLQTLASAFRDINEDLVDLIESYRVRSVSQALRGKRCDEFETAVVQAISWLDLDSEENELPEFVANLQGRAFPAAIRR